ncbi:MAG: response regulator [Aphanocapsa sp. GSE-SYN-MK-11-07L]|jgi:DNA-binding response OmpR family regulator|nr:response regulator [Aphanocapsa sp. GSE-SYN-MK-11-07L]
MTKILVIEDEPPVRANILDLLEAEGFEIMGAENGLIGALAAQEHQPDLIICDVMMPEINGHEVLEVLQLNPSTAVIPFIFLTAMADKADIRHGMQLGADDYLTKPFSCEELLAAIATRLAKQAAVMQEYESEHQRVQALKLQLHELQQVIASKTHLCEQLQQRVQTALPKLTIAANMLKKLSRKRQRDHYLPLLQTACAEELRLLEEMPHLQSLLTLKQQELLQQLT